MLDINVNIDKKCANTSVTKRNGRDIYFENNKKYLVMEVWRF